MLPSDGEFVFYRVECFKGADWYSVENWDQVPKEARYVDIKCDRLKQPFHDFSASGDCWQRTGHHGTFSPYTAAAMLGILTVLFPWQHFRMVRITLSQKRRVILENKPETDED